MDLLISELQPLNALALRVSVETGLRIGDVVELRASALDGVRISTTARKTRKKVAASVTARTADALRLASDGRWLFPSPRSKTGHRTRQAVWRDVRRVADRLGIRVHVTPHSARKLFAVERYHKDGLAAAQELLQHDRSLTTMLYAFSDKITADEIALARKKNVCKRPMVTLEMLVEALGGREVIEDFLTAFVEKAKKHG